MSDDGLSYRKVCDIPHGGAARQTIEFEPVTARYFRVTFDNPVLNNPYAALSPVPIPEPTFTPVAELVLYPVPRINHAEEKAGYATPSDLMEHPTFARADEVVGTQDVFDVTDKVDAEGNLHWNAPQGDWTIYRFGYSLTGKTNHPAATEATGLEVSKIDKDAFTDFLTYYLDTCMHDYDRTMDLNYRAHVALTLALLPKLCESQGHIIYTSSVSALYPPAPGWSAYHASKCAANTWYETARTELRRQGISVQIACLHGAKIMFFSQLTILN